MGEVPEKITPHIARKILNVHTFSSQQRINQQGKGILAVNHPDRGGSAFLSQLTSQALKQL